MTIVFTFRYSFKIPRPFAHFVASKDYDSSHISYPNAMFDHDPEHSSNENKPDVVKHVPLARDNNAVLIDTTETT